MADKFGITTGKGDAAEKATEGGTYVAGGGKMSYHGITYQLRLLMLFILRGLRMYCSFTLATDMDDADKFDDVVFRYDDKISGKITYRFLQAKHRAGKNLPKMTYAVLLPKDSRGDFNLRKYFKSFLKIADKFKGENVEIKDLIICTNTDFKYRDVLDGVKLGDVLEKTKNESDEELEDEILGTTLLRIRKDTEVRKVFVNYLMEEGGRREDSLKEIEAFLDKITFAPKQPNCEELKVVIRNIFANEYNINEPDVVYSLFEQKVAEWMMKFEGRYYTVDDGKSFFESVRKMYCSFRFGYKDPVKHFKGRVLEMEKLEEARTRGVKIAVVSGLGGIGKSEFAKRYIQKNSRRFHRIVWVHAESEESMVRSFHRLAFDRLGISKLNANREEKDIRSIAEEVHRFFQGDNCIFVFDNLEKSNRDPKRRLNIREILPPSTSGAFTLFTSRYERWGDLYVLPLSTLRENDSVEFIRCSLGLSPDADEEPIKALARKLCYFPLSLNQAVSYIKYQEATLKPFGMTYTIEKYLNLYKKETEKLLDFENPEFTLEINTQTTFNTWNITLESIQKEICGNVANRILKLISFFSPDRIEMADVSKYFADLTEDEIIVPLSLIKNYSLVEIEKGEIKIHRLVQKVIRLKLKKEREDENVIEWGLTSYVQINVEHVISLWRHVQKHKLLAEKYCSLGKYIIDSLTQLQSFEEGFLFGVKCLMTIEKHSEGSEEIVMETKCSFAKAAANHGKYGEAVKVLEEVYRARCERLGGDHPKTLEGRELVANMLEKLGKYDNALSIYEEVYEKRKRISGENSPQTQTTRHNVALLLKRIGKYESALSIYEEVYKKRKEILGDEHPDTLTTRHNMASIFKDTGNYGEALKLYEEVYEKRKIFLGEKKLDTLTTRHNIALSIKKLGHYERSIAIYEEVYQNREGILGNDHPETLITRHNLASALQEYGKYSRAYFIYKEVYEKRKEVIGDLHPYTTSTRNLIGVVLRYMGKYREAYSIFEEVCIKSKESRWDHPDTLTFRNNLASTLKDLGRYEDALIIFKELFEKRKRISGDQHPETLVTAHSIATVYHCLGKYDDAISGYEDVYEKRKITLGSDHPYTLTTMQNLALVLKMSGKYDKALPIYEDIYGKRKQILGEDHPDSLTTLNLISSVLHAKGKYIDALNACKKVYERRKHILGEDHPYTLITRNNLASCLLTLGECVRAYSILEEVYREKKEALGEENPSTLSTRHNMAYALKTSGEYDKALTISEEVWKERREILGDTHPDTLTTRNVMASIFEGMGKRDKAYCTYEEVYRKRRDSLGDDHPSTLVTRQNMAYTLYKSQKDVGEIDILEEIYRKRKEILGYDHPDTIITKNIIESIQDHSSTIQNRIDENI